MKMLTAVTVIGKVVGQDCSANSHLSRPVMAPFAACVMRDTFS